MNVEAAFAVSMALVPVFCAGLVVVGYLKSRNARVVGLQRRRPLTLELRHDHALVMAGVCAGLALVAIAHALVDGWSSTCAACAGLAFGSVATMLGQLYVISRPPRQGGS